MNATPHQRHTTQSGSLLTVEQAATRLNLSVQTLHRMRNQGRGPVYVELGPRTIRYSPTAVQNWLNDPDPGGFGDTPE